MEIERYKQEIKNLIVEFGMNYDSEGYLENRQFISVNDLVFVQNKLNKSKLKSIY